jgi:hypothetical protein
MSYPDLTANALDGLSFSERLYVRDVIQELKLARDKFPTWPNDPQHALGIVHEEVGELQKDVLQLMYEPNKGKTLEHVRAEALQVAAMALRFYFNLPKYAFAPGGQHKG